MNILVTLEIKHDETFSDGQFEASIFSAPNFIIKHDEAFSDRHVKISPFSAPVDLDQEQLRVGTLLYVLQVILAQFLSSEAKHVQALCIEPKK